jgi:hypothetical protein
MNSFLLLVFIGCFTLRASAGSQGNQFKSPAGRHAIVNLGDGSRGEGYFEIQTTSGEVLFSPKHDPENSLGLGHPFLDGFADDVIWSPNEKFVLFTFETGKYRATAIYSFADHKLISLGHVTDGRTVPVRWCSSRTFVVEHCWPTVGRMSPQTRYRETYRVGKDSFALDCVYRGKWVSDEPESEGE